MATDLLRILLLATIASSMAMLLLLALRKPMRRRFGAHAAYALWILAPLSALVALLPAPEAALSMQIVPVSVTALAAAMPASATPLAHPFDPAPWIAGIWLLGVGMVCLLFARQQRRFVRGLGHLSAVGDETLVAQATAGCPALLGAWRPRVVLPADFEQRYSVTERALILAHERTHRARGDAQINALAAVLRCAFWFNPLIHFVASRFRFDQELACDAVVVSRFPEARRSYADAMLKTQLADFGLPVGCHWQSSHPLKERIAMLKQPLPGRARAALGAGIAVALIIGGTYAAWAVQPVSAPAAIKSLNAITTRANITWTIDSGPPHTIVLDSLDEPFDIREGEATNPWELHGTGTPLQDGSFEFDVVLRHAGAIVSNPKLIVRTGGPGEIRVGNETGGKFEGVVVQIALWLADGAAAGPVRTSATAHAGDTKAGYRALRRIVYPAGAIAAKVGGVVYVKAHIATNGSVTTATIDRIDPPNAAALADAAIAGVKTWTFDPAQKQGRPVASDEIVPIVFALNAQMLPTIAGATLDAIRISPPDAGSSKLNDAPPTENVSFRRSDPPKYPQAALNAHQSAKVTLKVLVDETGSPASAEIVKVDPPQNEKLFADASVAAAMQWRYNPGIKDGRPQAGYVFVPIDFLLDDKD
jgi:TonB family protein